MTSKYLTAFIVRGHDETLEFWNQDLMLWDTLPTGKPYTNIELAVRVMRNKQNKFADARAVEYVALCLAYPDLFPDN